MNRRSSMRLRANRQPPSFDVVEFKLSRIVSHHEQLKVAFHQLHSHILSGLSEAEDVLNSLAIPLMKLVGLKTDQMAAEGRFTLVTSITASHSQEDKYMTIAMNAANELKERQKLQLVQLMSLLKKIEFQVNSSHNNIFESLVNQQASIKRFIKQAFTYVSAIHQSVPSNELPLVMLKILKETFDQVGDAFRSVEFGVDGLICELAEKMCKPMVQYVKGLNVEMNEGTSLHLLKIVKEMAEAMKIRKIETEEAIKQARLEEQRTADALRRQEKSEEIARKLATSLALLVEDAPKSEENYPQRKVSGTKEEKVKDDDNLLWDLLRAKRKCKMPDSPVGTSNKRPKVLGPVTRSQSVGRTSVINPRMLLGSSPSATTSKRLISKAGNSLTPKPKTK